MLRNTLLLFSAMMLAVGVGSTARAADEGLNVPAAADPKVWNDYIAKVEEANAVQDWSSVSGALVAQSNFRPFGDGFSFFNTGVPDNFNAAMFGAQKSGPKNLNGKALRSLMGPKACVGGNKSGKCRLTLAGKSW